MTNGGLTLCDEADFDSLSRSTWFHVSDRNQVYAARFIGRSRIERMHTVLLGEKGIDHINGNGLDNRRFNLRVASNSQNQMNRGKFAEAHSAFKGVTWHKRDRRWTARIKVNGRRIYLGSFKNERDAAHAYNLAAVSNFGAFARINLL